MENKNCETDFCCSTNQRPKRMFCYHFIITINTYLADTVYETGQKSNLLQTASAICEMDQI